mmetsp:Transcript_3864/g.5897  ORF Transcript_3864/g.5897 Transcript_3864/m.5897 type:complete len:253 (+) Transcript_3864:838-1596(+)
MQRPLTLGVLMQRLQALGSRGLPLSTILDLSSLGCDDVPFASRGTHGGESPWTPPLLAGSSSSAALGGRLPPSSVVGRSMASSGNVSLYRGGLLAPVLASPRAVPAKSAGSSSPGSRFFRTLLVSHPITDTILSAVELHAYAASDIFEHDFMAHKRHRPQLLADHIRDMASYGDAAAGDFYDRALLALPLITTPVTSLLAARIFCTHDYASAHDPLAHSVGPACGVSFLSHSLVDSNKKRCYVSYPSYFDVR